MTQEHLLSTTDSPRIQALKDDLLYFRCLLEQMVQKKTQEVYKSAILKSRNSMLGDNCRKMHNKYLDLLNTTQVREAEKHLRALENELSMLVKYQVSQA
jgi:hypothetical protein